MNSLNKQVKEMNKLKSKLLSIGGEVAIIDIDEELDRILKRGKLFKCNVTKFVGTPGQCHRNSTDLWEQNKKRLRVCTGYALCRHSNTNKLTWICHSWCWDKATKNIIETNPYDYKAYFGFVMLQKEAENFLSEV